MYNHGKGVNNDGTKAWKCYHKSYDDGCFLAAHDMGKMLIGNGYFENDYKTAMSLFTNSASGGCAIAKNAIGTMYFESKCGVNQDNKIAYQWFKEAYTGGCAVAAHNIGVICISKMDSDKWYRKAVILGHYTSLLEISDVETLLKTFHDWKKTKYYTKKKDKEIAQKITQKFTDFPNKIKIYSLNQKIIHLKEHVKVQRTTINMYKKILKSDDPMNVPFTDLYSVEELLDE